MKPSQGIDLDSRLCSWEASCKSTEVMLANMAELNGGSHGDIPFPVTYDVAESHLLTEDLYRETDKFFQMVWWSVLADQTEFDEDNRRSQVPPLKVLSLERLSSIDGEDMPDGIFSFYADVTETQTPKHSSQQFGEKTQAEREEITKYVASKLDEIARDVERTYGHTPLPKVEDLLLIQNYDAFSSAIGEALGPDPSVSQLAMCFRLAQDIVKVAAKSNTGSNLVTWTRAFFQQKLAPWVVDRHGLEACVVLHPNE